MMKLPIQVGVTGGIGSGKTIVCEIFSHLGVPVYNADHRARFLMENLEILVEKIRYNFGDESYREGKINRDFLAREVFNNPENLAVLNAIVHPQVAIDFHEWVTSLPDVPYLVKEAALMIESGAHEQADVLIVVTAPEDLRVKRVLKRDPFRNEEEVLKIMHKQLSEEDKVKLADHVIVNDGQVLVIPQVLKLHELFIKLSRSA